MRASGIIMHISSLPSPYGIGTLGKEARRFADFLASAGQKYWQLLPMNPTGFGDSPYQALSTFAGNHYFIDLDTLVAEGLLHEDELDQSWGSDPGRVDFERLYNQRLAVLRLAYERFIRTPNRDFVRFVTGESDWIRDYALFMALKEQNGTEWRNWQGSIRYHIPEALKQASNGLRYEITFHYFLQYEFFRQWQRLRDYCAEKGIRLIGDVPIYVPLDSADVWANSRLFQLDDEGTPTAVAGCPADQFNEDGQLWGNPLYDWETLREEGYDWWLKRLRAAARMYDVVRLDHFRGFESYWAVPYGAPNAREGEWRDGPGLDFIHTLNVELPELEFIAEDLGFLTPEVIALREQSGFPGMKVLEFAFDPEEPSEYLPHNYEKECVCYTGTHDNAPILQWFNELPRAQRIFARYYLGLNDDEGTAWGIIRGGMGSVAMLFMAQMQDYLPTAFGARMNEPGTVNDLNWRWRVTPSALRPELARRIREMTALYGRLNEDAQPKAEEAPEPEAPAEKINVPERIAAIFEQADEPVPAPPEESLE